MSLDLGPRLSLIIASRDEGDEITRTCQSALDEAEGPVEIIVIDDASKKPAVVPGGVRLHRVEKPLGLFAAKRLAVSMMSTEGIVVSDAHVRFSKGWDAVFADAISDRPDAVHVALGTGLINKSSNPDWIPDLSQTRGKYYGANFVVRRRVPKKGLKILESVWQSRRKSGAIPSPMGSVYGISKAWWLKVDMLAGLQIWGGQEPDMALRTWLAGGEVLLAPEVQAAHVFREVAPYPSDVRAIWLNRLWMAAVLTPRSVGQLLLDELAARYPDSAKLLDMSAAAVAKKRFNEVRAPHSWEKWIERFPEICWDPA